MIRKLSLTILVASLSAFGATAFAAGNDGEGAYAGVAVGQAHLSTSDIGIPKTAGDTSQTSFKLYGGTNFSRNLGLEVGYANLGKVAGTYTTGTGPADFSGRASSLYVAGTARAALSDAFTVKAKLGVGFNRTSGSSNGVTQFDMLHGSKTQLVAGVGAEYNIAKNLALTVDAERYGKVSDAVSANNVSAGLKLAF
jgi:OOP family OmpA-OmpF porin